MQGLNWRDLGAATQSTLRSRPRIFMEGEGIEVEGLELPALQKFTPEEGLATQIKILARIAPSTA